jgi:hypothetical protein
LQRRAIGHQRGDPAADDRGFVPGRAGRWRGQRCFRLDRVIDVAGGQDGVPVGVGNARVELRDDQPATGPDGLDRRVILRTALAVGLVTGTTGPFGMMMLIASGY